MSDHSDLVARLRALADSLEGPYPEDSSEVRLLREAADRLDVKPGANADLIAEAKQRQAEPCRSCVVSNSGRCRNHGLIKALAAALEAADSRRVLPTREQIVDAIQEVCRKYFLVGVLADRNRKCASRIADAVLALLTGGKADGE